MGDTPALAFGHLSPIARKKILLITFSQVLLGFLEIISLYLLTIIIALGLSITTGITESKSSLKYVWFLREVSVNSKIVVLASIFVFLFFIKSIISVILTRKTYSYLSHQSAVLGNRLTQELFVKRTDLLRFGKSQELLAAVTSGVDSLIINLIGGITSIVSDVFGLLLLVGVIFAYDWQTGLLLIVFLGISGKLLSNLTTKKTRSLSETYSKLSSNLRRSLLDEFSVYREVSLSGIKAGRLESSELLRSKVAFNWAKLVFVPNISKYFLESSTLIVALLLASYQLLAHDLLHAITTFSLILAALSRILPNALRIQTNWLSIKGAIGAATFSISLIEELKSAEDSSPLNPNEDLETFSPSIKLENVTFTYPNSNIPVIKNLSLEIKEGEFVAIVGRSGSGKSTLVDIVLGFLIPQYGWSRISGIASNKATKRWPGAIALVPQDVSIIDRSILENISLNSRKLTDLESVRHSITVAGLDDEIGALPDGINTFVGERGLLLSGGQRQRLGIARAVYSNPKLIIFDEATSALDAITEDIISKNVLKAKNGVTTIVVAHRLSTVMKADKVFYLDGGVLLGIGTFNELRSQFPEFDKQAELSGL